MKTDLHLKRQMLNILSLWTLVISYRSLKAWCYGKALIKGLHVFGPLYDRYIAAVGNGQYMRETLNQAIAVYFLSLQAYFRSAQVLIQWVQ